MVRKKYNKKEIANAVFFSLLAIIILTFYLWHLTENVRIGYEIKKLENQALTCREEVQRLEAKKAALLSLDRVERIAKEELKLTEPRESQIFYEDFKPRP